jgi:hypothetical protein
VLWCDSELTYVFSFFFLFFSTFTSVLENLQHQHDHMFLSIWNHSKFTNVFGSSRLLGSLALSPPGLRRQETTENVKLSLSKERHVSYLVSSMIVYIPGTYLYGPVPACSILSK